MAVNLSGSVLYQAVDEKKLVTQNAFRLLFTFDELVAIETATQSDMVVKVLVEDLKAVDELDLLHVRIASALDVLISKSLILQARKQQVIDGIAQR